MYGHITKDDDSNTSFACVLHSDFHLAQASISQNSNCSRGESNHVAGKWLII